MGLKEKGGSGYSLTSMVPVRFAVFNLLHVCVSLVLWIARDLLLEGHYNIHTHKHTHTVRSVGL